MFCLLLLSFLVSVCFLALFFSLYSYRSLNYIRLCLHTRSHVGYVLGYTYYICHRTSPSCLHLLRLSASFRSRSGLSTSALFFAAPTLKKRLPTPLSQSSRSCFCCLANHTGRLGHVSLRRPCVARNRVYRHL